MLETTTRDLQPQSLQSLADKASTLHGRSLALWRECADVVLQAKTEAKHGQWRAFLKEAGISEPTARRMVRVAERGLSLAFIEAAGGIVRALEYLDAYDEAMKWYTASLAVPMSEDDHGLLLQARPDGPVSVGRWLDFGEALATENREKANELCPWQMRHVTHLK